MGVHRNYLTNPFVPPGPKPASPEALGASGIPRLDAHARCDQCGNHAWFRVVVDKIRGLFLDFCYHDFNINEYAFIERGFDWEDNTETLKGGSK